MVSQVNEAWAAVCEIMLHLDENDHEHKNLMLAIEMGVAKVRAAKRARRTSQRQSTGTGATA